MNEQIKISANNALLEADRYIGRQVHKINNLKFEVMSCLQILQGVVSESEAIEFERILQKSTIELQKAVR